MTGYNNQSDKKHTKNPYYLIHSSVVTVNQKTHLKASVGNEVELLSLVGALELIPKRDTRENFNKGGTALHCPHLSIQQSVCLC